MHDLWSLLAKLFGLWNRVGVDRELYDISFDRTDKLSVDIVVVRLMTGRAVLPGQLNAISFDAIDGADMSAVLT